MLNVLQAGSAQGGGGSDASTSLTLTAGNLVVVFTSWNGNGSGRGSDTASVSTNLGDTFTQVGSYVSTAFNVGSMWMCPSVVGGSTTIRANNSGSRSKAMSAIEISGAHSSPLDANANGNNLSTSPVTSGSFSTGTADEIIILGAGNYYKNAGYTAGSIAGTTGTIPSGASSTTAPIDGEMFTTLEYRIVSATQSSQTAAINLSGTVYCTVCVGTFKIAAGQVFHKTILLNQAVNRASTY